MSFKYAVLKKLVVAAGLKKTYKVMLRDYDPERISVLGTSSGGKSGAGHGAIH